MKIETYTKANKLQKDINSLEKIINDVDKEGHWISVVSACCQDECLSNDFCKDLLEFLKNKVNEYKKEFCNLSD